MIGEPEPSLIRDMPADCGARSCLKFSPARQVFPQSSPRDDSHAPPGDSLQGRMFKSSSRRHGKQELGAAGLAWKSWGAAGLSPLCARVCVCDMAHGVVRRALTVKSQPQQRRAGPNKANTGAGALRLKRASMPMFHAATLPSCKHAKPCCRHCRLTDAAAAQAIHLQDAALEPSAQTIRRVAVPRVLVEVASKAEPTPAPSVAFEDHSARPACTYAINSAAWEASLPGGRARLQDAAD